MILMMIMSLRRDDVDLVMSLRRDDVDDDNVIEMR